MNYLLALSNQYPNVRITCIGSESDYNNLIWEGGDPMPTQTELDAAYLIAMKYTKWQLIKAERDRRRLGGVHIEGKWFHSDDTSRIQQIGLVMFGAFMPENLMWKTMDGTFILMTPTLAGHIFTGVATCDQVIFTLAEQKKAEMEAMTDPSTYDVYTGWPLIYGE